MNIVSMLKKQIDAGKNVVMSNGAVVSVDNIKKEATKNYIAGLKAGEIAPSVSLDDYMKENTSNYVTAQDIIDIVENGIEEAEPEYTTEFE